MDSYENKYTHNEKEVRIKTIQIAGQPVDVISGSGSRTSEIYF